MSLTINDIECWELADGSGKLSLGSSQTATQRFKVAWASALLLAMFFRGWTKNEDDEWVTCAPYQHPWGMSMYCTDVAIQPFGKPTGYSQWEYALLDLSYKPLVLGGEGFATEAMDEGVELSGELLDLGSAGWGYETGGAYDSSKPVDRPVQKLVPMVNYEVTKYHVTNLNLDAIYGVLGTLNNASFRGLGAGKVLYAGCSAQRRVMASFENNIYLDWTVKHKFMMSKRDLRHEWKAGAGFQMVRAANGDYKFDLGNFGVLGVGA